MYTLVQMFMASLLSYITWPFTLKQNAGIHVLYSLLWASNAIASTLDTFQSFLFWFVCLLVYGSYFNYLMVWFWVSGEVLSDLPLISQYLVSKHTQTQMGKTPAPVVMDHYIFQRNNVSISHGRRMDTYLADTVSQEYQQYSTDVE